MRFSSIWSLPGLPLTERLVRTRDWAAQELAGRLPRRLRYWVTMLDLAKATKDSPNILATTLDEILRKLDAPKNLR